VAVPHVYLLRGERGINAFAAGYSPHEAVLAVTEGATRTLTRDELQAVVAHEFSHILSGDMRLSVQMIGVLAGILFIGEIGNVLLRSRASDDRRAGGAGPHACAASPSWRDADRGSARSACRHVARGFERRHGVAHGTRRNGPRLGGPGHTRARAVRERGAREPAGRGERCPRRRRRRGGAVAGAGAERRRARAQAT